MAIVFVLRGRDYMREKHFVGIVLEVVVLVFIFKSVCLAYEF